MAKGGAILTKFAPRCLSHPYNKPASGKNAGAGEKNYGTACTHIKNVLASLRAWYHFIVLMGVLYIQQTG